MNKEQSSTSTQEVPKHKFALEEKYKEDKKNKPKEKDLANAELTKLPNPTGWRILVLPFKPKRITKGGVHIADTAAERQHVATVCGLVLDIGPDCYRDKERYPRGPWCKKGEWVMFARYAGSRFKIEGGEIRILNEDEILATIQDPEQILHDI